MWLKSTHKASKYLVSLNKQWRTIDSYALYRDKILLGMHYRAFLAQELMNLGFDIVQTSDKGTFELKDFPPELIRHFSKRRADIVAALEKRNLKGGKASRTAALETRPYKRNVDLEHLTLAWAVELQQCGSSLEALQAYCHEAQQRGPVTPPNPENLAYHAVFSAIAHLSERQGVFDLKALVKASLGVSITLHPESLLHQAVTRHLKKGHLLYLGHNQFTTQSARDTELENLAAMRLHRGQINPIFNKVDAWCLTRGQEAAQKHALRFLLNNRDRETAIIVHHKNDFATVMTAYCNLISDYHLYPLLLTQTAARAQSFAKELGMPYSRTIEGFLLSCEIRKTEDKTPSAQWVKDARAVWIIDSQTTVTLTQVRRLQDYASHFGARIIWGYHAFKQPFAIRQLLKNGLRHAEMANIRAPIVPLLQERNLEKIFDSLHHNHQITEIPNFTERIEAVAKRYVQSPKDTQILVVSHYERHAINNAIRALQVENGTIAGASLTFKTLQPIKLTRAQLARAKFYQLNDIVRLSKAVPELPVAANTYLTVTDVQLQNGKITLTDGLDQSYPCKLNRTAAQVLSLYRTEPKSLQVNDVIVWNQTIRNPDNRLLDRLNGERAVVTAVHKTSVTVQLKNQSTLELALSNVNDHHWDYGYAKLLSNEAFTQDPVILALKGKTELLTYERFANALASAQNIHLICDDKVSVQENLFQYTGETLSALEKPVQPYTPESLDTAEGSNARLKEYFPRFTARMTGTFAEHRELLNQVMSDYEQERAAKASEASVKNSPASALYPLVEARQAAKAAPTPDKANTNDSAIQAGQALEACRTIDWLCAKYGERDAVFYLADLQKELFKLAGLTIPESILTAQLQFAMEQILVLVEDDPCNNVRLVTTKEMIALEKACLYLAEKFKGTVEPVIAEDSRIVADLKCSDLTDGQKAAVQLVMTSADRVVGIQGVAGSGKTTMLRTLNRHCLSSGYQLLGLSNGTAARQKLQRESRDVTSKEAFLQAGINTLTTRKFLIQCESLLKRDKALARVEYGGNRILVLDEASFTSTRDLFALLNVVNQLNIRLVVMGDYKQLNSVEAGRIFYLLLGSSMKSVAMTENVRFKAFDALQTMQCIYKDDIQSALAILKANQSLIEIPDRIDRLEHISQLYLEKEGEARANTLVITPWHKDRTTVNELIHKGLKKQGVLEGKSVKVPILTPVNMTQTEKERIYAFKEAQLIRFNQAAVGVAIGRGEYCQVIQKNFQDQTVLLKKSDGSQVVWSPERNIRHESGAIEVYEPESRQVMVNETIRWLKNDEARGIRNGETATIVSVTKSAMEVKCLDGSHLTLVPTDKTDQHWDYAYAATAYIAQGAEKPETIAHGMGGAQSAGKKPDTKTPKLTSVEEFLVSVTRGDKVTLVVDDIENYQNALYETVNELRSTQEYLAPDHETVRKKVHQMTRNITGRAKRTSPAPQPNAAHKAARSTQNEQQLTSAPSRKVKRAFIDKNDILEQLDKNILGFATQWLGRPHTVSGKAARWGKKGSLVVYLSGAKAGYWYDFESGKGGKDLISLYTDLYKVAYPEALKELGELLGIAPKAHSRKPMALREAAKKKEAREAKIKKAAAEIAKEEAKKIQTAQDCYAKGSTIANTLAETYLRVHRGLAGPFPSDFRFSTLKHRDTGKLTPALIAPIRNRTGEITGVVRIFLEKNGEKLKATYIDALGENRKAASKMNLGSMTNAAVIVQEGKSTHTLYIAEGVETALSIAAALPNARVCASLSVSHLRNVPVPQDTKTIVLCADEDGNHASSTKSLVEAANHYLQQGLKIKIAYPPKMTDLQKTDFNDLLKRQGVEAVSHSLKTKIIPSKDLTEARLMHLKNQVYARTPAFDKTQIPQKTQSHTREIER